MLTCARPIPLFNAAPFPLQCRSRRLLPAPRRSRPARPSCVTPAGTCAGARCCGCRTSTSTSSASSAKVSGPARLHRGARRGPAVSRGPPPGCLAGPHSVPGNSLGLGYWRNGSPPFIYPRDLFSVACLHPLRGRQWVRGQGLVLGSVLDGCSRVRGFGSTGQSGHLGPRATQ